MNTNAYETYDLTLAAFLLASEAAQLIDITSNGDGRKLFGFTPAPTKGQLIRFYSGEALVSARRFAEAFSTLKGAGYTMRDIA